MELVDFLSPRYARQGVSKRMRRILSDDERMISSKYSAEIHTHGESLDESDSTNMIKKSLP